MIYEQHTGREPYVTIPSHQGTDCITGIGAKAFLSHKEIHKLNLPPTITQIDDWAFAHMHNLKELRIPAAAIRFGKNVFLDCCSLQQIHVFPDTSGNPGLPFFLASVITSFSDSHLLCPLRAASADTHEEWMQDYDRMLTSFLDAEDAAGFEPVFYGWFNDEDADTSQLPAYLKKQRENKARLTFLRLRFDLYLSDSRRAFLQKYLRDHMPWGEKAKQHTAVWDLIPLHYAHDLIYLRILEDARILTTDTVPAFISHLEGAAAEIKAYLLRFQEKHRKSTDFFDNFSL